MAVPDSIPGAGVGSNDLEMLSEIVLPGLLGREPGPEQGEGFSLGRRGRGPRPLGCHNCNYYASYGRQRDAKIGGAQIIRLEAAV